MRLQAALFRKRKGLKIINIYSVKASLYLTHKKCKIYCAKEEKHLPSGPSLDNSE